MADILTSNSDPFASIGQDVNAQRKQIAQYAIYQAASYMQNSQTDQAIGAFKKALAIDPQNATAYNYLGQIYLSQGKNADSIKAYKQLVRLQSNVSLADTSSSAPTQAEARISLGNAYLQDKQFSASENEFKTAAKLDPTNPLPVYTLGHQYANTDRLPEAEAQFLKVKKLSPNDGNVFYSLGMVYNKLGRYEDAATNLEQSLVLKKNFPSANYELGVAYDALGKTEEARNQLSILTTGDPTQAEDLQIILNKPRITDMDTKLSGGFLANLGPGVPLWMLDPTLLTAPNSGKTFSITISFSTAMDPTSVTDPQNWSISRANSPGGGYYNYGMPVSSKDVAIPSKPESVIYNSLTGKAIVNFRLNQNSSGDAVIDTSHITFKFSGKDILGRDMDLAANEINGFSISSF